MPTRRSVKVTHHLLPVHDGVLRGETGVKEPSEVVVLPRRDDGLYDLVQAEVVKAVWLLRRVHAGAFAQDALKRDCLVQAAIDLTGAWKS
jgi:hypothetical protein